VKQNREKAPLLFLGGDIGRDMQSILLPIGEVGSRGVYNHPVRPPHLAMRTPLLKTGGELPETETKHKTMHSVTN
jgi:hypothetical protein